MSDAVADGGASADAGAGAETPVAAPPAEAAPVEVEAVPVETAPEPVVVETATDAVEVPEIEPVASENVVELEAVETPQGPADAPYDEGFSPSDVVAPAPPAPAAAPVSSVRSILAKGLEKIRFRKRAKLEKIITLARERGSITNDDVQLAVQVSDASASRYLTQLTREGRLRKLENGPSTRYEAL